MDYEHALCGGINAEAVVCPFAYEPDNVFAATQHPLLFFAQEGKLPVGHVVTYFFSAFHAEWGKDIALLPKP